MLFTRTFVAIAVLHASEVFLIYVAGRATVKKFSLLPRASASIVDVALVSSWEKIDDSVSLARFGC